jgi:t-SNARE complex subunit (syntaxin)
MAREQPFRADATMQQQLVIEQQDQILESIQDSLIKLTTISTDINTELKVQEGLLNEADQKMDDAKSGFDIALKKMGRLLKSSKKGQYCLILILFSLCCVLLFVFIYS